MTNEEINEMKLKELEERIKQLEDKVFNIWLSQYPPLAYEEPPKGWSPDYSTLGPFSKYNP